MTKVEEGRKRKEKKKKKKKKIRKKFGTNKRNEC